ncbi:phenoloxidase-activating factor 3 [Lutzomyia longipalpis]|uniref:phenoloxidase-activating factor 3 n=1 Tax=Lutzomyia longipalpis TaxID=7200 RepID=UPI0024836BB4|nr:phenoloxidase-activating factor 3 [Lutzomyia longipalpis]
MIILTLLPVVLCLTNIASAWDDFNYYDPYPDYLYNNRRSYRRYDSHEEDIFDRPCQCIKLKYCQSFIDILSRTTTTTISPILAKKFRKASCGFRNAEPVVCCPTPSTRYGRFNINKRDRGPTTEEAWVWDVEKEDRDTSNEGYDGWAGPKNRFNPNNFHHYDHHDYDRKPGGKWRNSYHPHFEDPDTRKNCPPGFSKEFDLPETVTPVADDAAISTTATPEVSTMDTKLSLINSELCGISVNTRIIGGEDAGPGQFPWMARLAYRNLTSGKVTYRCSGSVISDRYIVTAAHCVRNLIDDLQVVMVRLGELDTRSDIDCNAEQTRCTEAQDFEIERIIPHSMYDTPKYANDIALIRLRRRTNSSFISPLCLPTGQYANVPQNADTRAIIAGWGSMTAASNTPSPTLQWVRLPIVDNTGCADAYRRFSANSRTPIIVSDAQMCVQGRENMDACQGDSGGPLMSEGVPGAERYTLLGLVSFGPRTCGVSNFPGVYTRISSYIDWIMENIQV